MRIGHGFDIHKFGGTKPLIICGVYIPYLKGVLAYSDGDVALHAVIDALLGASALGDIGKLFSNTNIEFKDISSRLLLRKTWQLIKNIKYKKYNLGNIDITIIAQAPKILEFVPKMRSYIANDLNSHINNINIKITTTEGLGCVGREEGIACEAVALLINSV